VPLPARFGEAGERAPPAPPTSRRVVAMASSTVRAMSARGSSNHDCRVTPNREPRTADPRTCYARPMAPVDLVVLHEHPEWQKPLFSALTRRGVSFAPFDITRAAFTNDDVPRARLYFNQASPSAYIRGNTRAVPLALAFMRTLELRGARVLNGSGVFALELSKSVQATLLRTLGIDCPRSITFNDVSALKPFERSITWPAVLKPDQGGSGARIQVVGSLAEIAAIFERDPSIWQPDNLFLLQEYLQHDPDQGIVRLEFLGGELLYAMRVRTHGRFNLCPSPVCNPDEGDSACALPDEPAIEAPPVEFAAFPDVPAAAVRTAQQIVAAAGLDVGGIEYLETPDGRRVFYDINANSNLRPSVAEAFGFDPFERVVDYLVARLDR
jgi:glutathione synthase/RimK-type ligase-like ATP-grasp enzyme